MAAAITLVPAAPVPGAGSAMAPAGGEAPDPEAPDSKTPIVSSDDGEKDEDITPAVPEPAAPSTGPTSAPPSTPARPPFGGPTTLFSALGSKLAVATLSVWCG